MKLIKQRPMTVKELIRATGKGDSVIRNHLNRMPTVKYRLRNGKTREYWIGDLDEVRTDRRDDPVDGQ